MILQTKIRQICRDKYFSFKQGSLEHGVKGAPFF